MNNYIEYVRRWASIDVVQSALKYKKLSLYQKIFKFLDRKIILVNDLDRNRKFYCFCGFDEAADLYISPEEQFVNNFVLLNRATIEPDFEFKINGILLNFEFESAFTDFELNELKKAGLKFTGSQYPRFPYVRVLKYQKYLEDISNDDAEVLKFVLNTLSFADENIKGLCKTVKKIKEPKIIELIYSESSKKIELKEKIIESDLGVEYQIFKPEEPKSVLDYIGEHKKSGIWEIGLYSFPFHIPIDDSKDMIFDDFLIMADHATGKAITLKISENKGKVALVDEFLLKMKELKQVPKILFVKNLETFSFFTELSKILDIEMIIPITPMVTNHIWTSFRDDMNNISNISE